MGGCARLSLAPPECARRHLVDRDPAHPLHGPIHHLAYVVESIEATAKQLVRTLGAGPFFVVRDVPLEQVTSRGEPATFQHDSAFGQCGAMPVELIQIEYLEPARVREGFSQSPPRLHHAAYVVPRQRVAEARDELELRGLPAFLHATMGDLDSTLHDGVSVMGHHLELHADSQALHDFFAMVRNASAGWDGSDPLRSPGA